MTPEQLAKHLGDGWRVSDRGVAKGLARVWYYPSTYRYGAQFRNAINGVSSTADGATPEQALGVVLGNALRFARITLDDIEAVRPGFTKKQDIDSVAEILWLYAREKLKLEPLPLPPDRQDFRDKARMIVKRRAALHKEA